MYAVFYTFTILVLFVGISHAVESRAFHTPISELVPQPQHESILDKNLFKIVAEYASEPNITTISRNYNLTMQMVQALNTTSFGKLLSCFNTMKISKSIDVNLNLFKSQFQLSAGFKTKKLAVLNSSGYKRIGDPLFYNNITESLQFCKRLDMVILENLGMILFNDSLSLKNASAYLKSFQNLGVAIELLQRYVIAKYSADVENEEKTKAMIRQKILDSFASVTTANFSSNDIVDDIIQKTFQVPLEFVKSHLPVIIGYKSYLADTFGLSKFSELPGFTSNATLKNIIMESIKADSLLERFFSLPLFVAVSEVGVDVSDIKEKTTILKLALGKLGNQGSMDLVIRWFMSKSNSHQNHASFVLKNVFWSNARNVPLKLLLSISLYDYGTLVQMPHADIKKIGESSFMKHIEVIFNNMPIVILRGEDILAEDLNTKMFKDILIQIFFPSDPSLYNSKLTLKGVTKHYFNTFTGYFLLSQFKPITLGELAMRIEKKSSHYMATAVFDGKISHLSELCGEDILNLKMQDLLKKCADIDIEKDSSNVLFGKTLMSLKLVSQMSINATLARFSAQNITIRMDQISLRELVTVATEPSGLLLLKPFDQVFNISETPIIGNALLKDVFRQVWTASNISGNFPEGVLSSFTNMLIDNITVNSTASILRTTLTDLASRPFGELLRIAKAIDHIHYRIFLRLDQLIPICNVTDLARVQIMEIGELEQCFGNETALELYGYSDMNSLTFGQIIALGKGKFSFLDDMFSIAHQARKELDEILLLSAQPFILMARENGISIAELLNNTMTETITKIFKIDHAFLRKIFDDVPDDLYQIISQTPLKSLHLEDSGLNHPQQFYTASIQTMIAASLSDKNSTFHVEKHLGRLVKQIGSLNFKKLFFIYEHTKSSVEEMSLLNLLHDFFGIIDPGLMKLTFGLRDSQYNQLNIKMADIFEAMKYNKAIPHKKFEEFTLIEFLGFITKIGRIYYLFFLVPIADQNINANNTIAQLKLYPIVSAMFSHYVKSVEEVSLRTPTYTYLTSTTFKNLGKTFGKNSTETRSLNMVNIVKMGIYHMNECAVLPSVCLNTRKCLDKLGGYSCECFDGFSGNGTVCYDGCQSRNCDSNAYCINDINGPICRCNENYLYDNASQQCKLPKRVIKVKGMKFNGQFQEAFANKTSKAFLRMANKIEMVLLKYLKSQNSAVTGMKVISMKKGSIIVDVDVYSDDLQLKPSNITSVLSEGARNGDFSSLDPSTDFAPTSKAYDPCASNPCMEHATCSSTSANSYSCKCNDGYEKEDGKCEEEDDDKLAVKVAVPIVVILVLVVAIVLIYCCINKKKKRGEKIRLESADGFSNKAYDTESTN